MDLRLRRFSIHRRDRAAASPAKDELQSISYQSTSEQEKRPIFIYQPLGRNAREQKRLDESGLALKGVAYDSLSSGAKPLFGSKPKKGNGPIRLQTSHRTSSGELLTTVPDDRTIREDIREGDYIVGRKDKRDSRRPSSKTSVSAPAAVAHGSQQPTTMRPVAIQRLSKTSAEQAWSSLPASPMSQSTGFTSQATPGSYGEGVSPVSLRFRSAGWDSWNSSVPDIDEEAQPHVTESYDKQNATLNALWKAEHTRLAKLYGEDRASRLSDRRDRSSIVSPYARASPKAAFPIDQSFGESLPYPALDSLRSKRSSAGSVSSNYNDDTSDSSSSRQRQSMASSYAASSIYTTQTSTGESESLSAGDDIRKMIAEMRAAYLQAYDANHPPTAGTKSMKKRRKPRLSAAPNLSEYKSLVERQTWHGNDQASDDEETEEPVQRRTASHPVSSPFSRLSTIEASPSKEDFGDTHRERPDLKRADSMTLGVIFAGLTDESTNHSESESQF